MRNYVNSRQKELICNPSQSLPAETLLLGCIFFPSYSAVFEMFLDIHLWAVVCSPQPITAQGQNSIKTE